MSGLRTLLPFLVIGLGALLLWLSAWETEASRRRRGRITEWQKRRLPTAAHLAQEVRLAAWFFLAVALWFPAAGAHGEAPSFPARTLTLWVSLLLVPLLIAAGWRLGRSLPFSQRWRWTLAPFHGLSMWLLWLLGGLRERRRRRRHAPRSGTDAQAENTRQGVLELATLSLDEVMIPRSQVVALLGSRSVRHAAREIRRVPHAFYPVYGESIEQPLGVLRILDLASAVDPDRPIAQLARPVPIVPETMTGLSLLEDLCGAPIPAALVVDEFGGMAGFITVEDLVEVLVGDLIGEHEVVRRRILPQGGNLYRVEGACTVEEFNDRFGDLLPEGEYETVAGLFLDRVGVIPAPGERVELPRVALEVLEATERRILWLSAEVRSVPVPTPSSEHPPRSSGAPRG